MHWHCRYQRQLPKDRSSVKEAQEKMCSEAKDISSPLQGQMEMKQVAKQVAKAGWRGLGCIPGATQLTGSVRPALPTL